MKKLIGNNLIAQLQPSDKAYDIWDTKLTGFILRVFPSGVMTYRCEYARGKRVTIGRTTVLTPAQARDKAKQILSQATMGILPNRERLKQLTLKNFIEHEYTAWRIANRKNGNADLQRLKFNFIDSFGNCLLQDITPILIEKWRTRRVSEGRRAATINRDVNILKSALSKAVEWEFISENPLQKLKPFKIDSIPKIRFLNKTEEAKLKEALDLRVNELKLSRSRANEWREARNYACYPDLHQVRFPDHITPMVLLSLNTGLRRGELFALQWNDIDFERAILTVQGESTKNGKTRHIPLNAIALQVLKDWQADKRESLVFPNSQTGRSFGHVKRGWSTVLTKAEITNFRWHDMRHHFASKLVMAGADLNSVRELLGHADIKMTLRYAHLAPEHKAKVVAMLVDDA